jgi:hypothetical protein
MSDGGVSLDLPERAMGRRWLAVAAAALVTGAYAAQVVVSAAETSPASIAGIAPSYGPKTVSAVPNAAAIVRRIWLPGGSRSMVAAFTSPPIAATAWASVAVRAGPPPVEAREHRYLGWRRVATAAVAIAGLVGFPALAPAAVQLS